MVNGLRRYHGISPMPLEIEMPCGDGDCINASKSLTELMIPQGTIWIETPPPNDLHIFFLKW